MAYKKGERVQHPSRPDWGAGEVLADGDGNSVRVFFVGAGEKTLSTAHVQLDQLVGEARVNTVLDNLKVPSQGGGIRYQTLPDSISQFLEIFPQGFYGEKYLAHERDYKDKAHTLAVDLLSEHAIQDLLSHHDFPEITKRARTVMNATNLIFPNEKMALSDALKEERNQERFATALFALLYGTESAESRFMGFASLLEDVGAAKWTVATYFPFIVMPESGMFIKPTITQYAADTCAREINYTPDLNWMTYKRVLDFAHYLFEALAELRPRDMIDVQSFMWCIAPGKYRD